MHISEEKIRSNVILKDLFTGVCDRMKTISSTGRPFFFYEDVRGYICFAKMFLNAKRFFI